MSHLTSRFHRRPYISEYSLECIHQGKVRDTFALPRYPDLLLVVTTDRISTHNLVHQSTIWGKGFALTQMVIFWMTRGLKDIPNHLVAWGNQIYDYLPSGRYPVDLRERSIVIRKLDMIPIEFIFRSRMAGSLWKDFYSKEIPDPYGLNLPADLKLMSPFERSVFTPTDKSETDEPLNAEETMRRYQAAYQLALLAYETGREFALKRGIEIVDGKFEIGSDAEGNFIIADECLTPDSCRFVEKGRISIGEDPEWMDKQYVREIAERAWGKQARSPLLIRPEIMKETSDRYEKIAHMLTSQSTDDFSRSLYPH